MPTTRLDRAVIRDLPMFRPLSPEDLDAVLEHAVARRLAPGETAFRQGDPADAFFVLLHGRLKVTQTSADGQQVVVRHVNPGELFGIARAVRRPDFPGTAEALTESVAIAWPADAWDALVARCPALAVDALATVGQRLQDAHTRIRELATEAVERRVAHALLRLVRQAGRKTDEGILIDFPVSRQDIAEMTGATLHTVSRLMAAWEARGLIAGGRKRVTVRDPHALFMLAEGEGR